MLSPAPIAQTMYYRLILGCDANTVTTSEISVALNSPEITGTTGDVICGTGQASLSATGTGNTTFNWYTDATGGSPIGTGSPFLTPVISSTTTFYVTATTGGVNANTGLPAPLAATPGFGTTNFGLVFDVQQQFTLSSVTIYPLATTANTNGTVTIDVLDGTGAVVHSRVVNVVGNPTPIANTVSLGFVISPGTNYKIRPGARSAGIASLWFEPSATAPPGDNYGYPFTVPGVMSITHSTLGAAPGNAPRLDLYYYFYDWLVSTGCESPREPVVATVQPAPTATMSYAGSPYCSDGGNASITFTGTTGGTFSSSSGLSINSATGAVDLGASTPGTYTVTYTIAASGVCPQFDFTTPITVTEAPAATIAYTGSPYCADFGTATVIRTGTAGGTYSSTTGLVIDPVTGSVDLGASVPGVYTVTYAIAAGGGCSAFSTTAQLIMAAGNSWIGIVSTDWNNAGNWCGGIPTSSTDVIIPSFAPNMPLLSGGTGSARHITISCGASLTVGTGGTLNIYGVLYAIGTFDASTVSLAFRGSSIQEIPAFSALNVTQDGNGGVLLLGNAVISNSLTMTTGNIRSNGFNISLGGPASGSTDSHLVLENGSRVLLPGVAAGTNRNVPIGTTGSSYSPVLITGQAGHTTDDLSVGLAPNVYLNSFSGDRYTSDVVNRTWTIEESINGGSMLTLTFGWTPQEETSGFNRVRSYVIRHSGGDWIAGPVSASTNVIPYTQLLGDVSTLGRFAVRSESLVVRANGGNVYPNPARHEIQVVVNLTEPTLVTFSIFDSKGSMVMQVQNNVNASLSRTTIDVSRLTPGTYLVRAASASNEEIFAERFVKMD